MTVKIKKILKTILINLIAIIVILSAIELFCYLSSKNYYKDTIASQNDFFEKAGIEYRVKLKYQPIHKFDYEEYKRFLRPTIEYPRNKRPLLFVGCSYTNTFGLKDEQLLSYKIAKLTKRTTYNRARGGEGPQVILYQLQQKKFYKEIPDTEFIIYTFIYDHLYRIHRYQQSPFNNYAFVRYEYKNGKLKEIKPSFLMFYSLYTTQKIQSFIEKRKHLNKPQSFELFFQIMQESLKLAKQHYPNVKFVILLYKDSGWREPGRQLSKEQIDRLKKAGFIVIDAENLVGHQLTSDDYRLLDKDHPSEKAWNEIAPKLIQTLKL